MIRLILLLVLAASSSVSLADWPEWLGEHLQAEKAVQWEINANDSDVLFAPRGEHPMVWVLVSRKADSYDVALSTILKVFRREMPNVSFRAFLLPKRQEELVAWTKAADIKANMIYTVGSRATVSLHKIYAGGKLPVVSVNAKDPVLLGLTDNYHSSGNNFAYTSLNLPADITLSFLRRFKPSLTQIGVLYAKSNTSAYLTQFLPLQKEAEKQGVTVFPIEVDENNPELALQYVMQTTVESMKVNDGNLRQSLLWLTGSSSLLNRLDEINLYSEQLPLLTAVPDAVNGTQQSALMSVGVRFENNAHQAALYGIEVLKKGAAPASLPVG
ncbi:ABC transporter substrate binding protein, partial [Vibrio harveyi]|uniref:ABC transporter substrate binding protein n=1 Tax=Vibrio harveyi TaxID=669 RepID=UPI0006821897